MMIHDQWLICNVLCGHRADCWVAEFLVVALAAEDLQQEHVSTAQLPSYVPPGTSQRRAVARHNTAVGRSGSSSEVQYTVWVLRKAGLQSTFSTFLLVIYLLCHHARAGKNCSATNQALNLVYTQGRAGLTARVMLEACRHHYFRKKKRGHSMRVGIRSWALFCTLLSNGWKPGTNDQGLIHPPGFRYLIEAPARHQRFPG